MRSAETVLSIIRVRGKQGLPLEDMYRQLYNPGLYLMAYGRLYANKGAMTPGSTSETVDGMSRAKIARLIGDLRHERYRWTPVRRTYLAKKNGKLRGLGLPTWSDKLLQEVIRLILEAYYEPQFSSLSHGFRPGRRCHTALTAITDHWSGTKWFIEGDISQYFDTIDHTVLVSILGEKLKDNRFLRLISNLLKAGYLEEWKDHQTLSGSPQGGVVSPILSTIYLDKFDTSVEQMLIPADTRGTRRRFNPEYERLRAKAKRWKRAGRRKEKPRWVKKMAQRRRKTLVVCATCHENMHRGDVKPRSRKPSTSERSAVKAARSVRRGPDEKGVVKPPRRLATRLPRQ
jgi:retron-type reverse transcriptase